MAYSGIAQAGFILAPLAVAGEGLAIADKSVSAVVTYLVIYAAMNIGAFGVILAVSRKTKTAELESYNGLFQTSPSIAIVMTIFLASLAGIPPLGGWYAKFSVFSSLTSAGTGWGYGLAVVAAINAVIAFGYYGKITMRMWVEEPHEMLKGDLKIPVSLLTALVLTTGATIAFGVAPGLVTHFTDVSLIAVGN
jgi:NADH-quinone oxidoreductase subunit N